MKDHGRALAISWNDSKKEKKGTLGALFVAFAVTMALAAPAMRTSMSETVHEMVSVIVRAVPGGEHEVAASVRDAGGTLGRRLDIIDGFEAQVPGSAIDELRREGAVHSISYNGKLQFLGLSDLFDLLTDEGPGGGWFADSEEDSTEPGSIERQAGSMFKTARAIGAHRYYERGLYGQGVDVAMIDTGVTPVDGLPAERIINGPDLSFESQYDETRYLDTNGHGTHLAGVMVGGRMEEGAPVSLNGDRKFDFQGIAPRSRLVSIKVGQADGAADVSQVIAAIDWVVQYGRTNGLNIRVLNLSFGTDGVQDYMLDPLTFAVEQAWHRGIAVVVAAGNAGFGSPKLNNPAYDPYVIAVGSNDTKGTLFLQDDTIPDWSSRGNAERHPDFVAPGQSIVSLRDPESVIDEANPQARVTDLYFRGSGTSQSAAVVSGAIALMLSHRPSLTPDQVKAALIKNAREIYSADDVAQGAGVVNLRRIENGGGVPSVSNSRQTHPRATGTGSLEASRGSVHVADEDGVELVGEMDIMGMPFDGRSWSTVSASGRSWSGGAWNGSDWAGDCLCGTSWSGSAWSGRSWSGTSWSGRSWSGRSWSGRSWSGRSWSGESWAGRSWSGRSWSGRSWSGRSWSSVGYDAI